MPIRKNRTKNDCRKFLEIDGKTNKKCWKKTKNWRKNKYFLIVTKMEQSKKYEDLNDQYGN